MSQNFVAAGLKPHNQLNSASQLRTSANQGHFQNLTQQNSTQFNQKFIRTGRSSSSQSSASNSASASNSGFRFLKLGAGLSGSSLDTQVNSLNDSNFIRNSLDSAHNIGNFSGNNRYSWQDSLDSTNSSDYYKLSITNTTMVKASLANAAGTTLHLLNANGSEVKSSSQNGKLSSRLRSGTYYMQVSGDGTVDYTLNLKGTGIANDAGNRPQTALDAGDLSRSDRTFKRVIGGKKDRDDVYQFSLSETSQVEFALGNLSKDASLQLLDGSGNPIATSNNSGSTDESLSQQLGQGTYYVKVSTSSKSTMRYALEMSTGSLNSIDTNNTNGGNTNGGNTNGGSTSGGNTSGSNTSGGSPGVSNPTKGSYYLKLTRTYRKESNGLEDLNLALMQGNQIVDKVTAVSGQPGKQYFRKAGDSISGSMEPLPEGKWSLGNVEWAGSGKGSYSGSWGEGLGPVWVSVNPEMYTKRSDIGIHWDYNASYSPGTSGCIGITNKGDLQKVVSWFDNSLTAPKETIVDWGLGSV